MSAATRYAVGDRVVYWQPGVAGILASWAGSRSLDGEERTVTITAARVDEWGTAYYDTDGDVVLVDSDIRRRA